MMETRSSNLALAPPGAPCRVWGIISALLAIGIVLGSSTLAVGQDRMFFPATDNAQAEVIRMINAEQVRLDIATWYLNDGEITQAILNKHRSGVPVRLIGDRGSIFEADPNTRASFELLARNGVPIRLRYHPTWFPFIIHWKCGIFKGQGTVEFGSGNWTTDELKPFSATNFKDETALFSSDVTLLNAFLTIFDQYWANTTEFLDWPDAWQAETGQTWPFAYPAINRARREPDNDNAPGMIWSQGDEARAPDLTSLTNAMLYEINRETQAIDIVIYRLTIPAITDALIARHRAGVAVRVFVEPTQYRNNLWPEYELTGANVDRLRAAGVPIKQRQHEGLMHMKTLITSNIALNGSSNFTKNWERDHNYFISAQAKPGLWTTMKNRFNVMWNDSVNYVPMRIQNPSPPANASPANSAANVPTTTALVWNRASWATSYDVYLGTSAGSQPLVGRVDAVLNEDPPKQYSFTPSQPLLPNTTYYWRVVARTFATEASATADFWAFTTGAAVPRGGTGSGPFGTTPVLWQHQDGRVAVWYMRDASLIDGRPFGEGVLPPGWRIAATGDFDRDGNSDVVLQNQADGRLAIWLMRGPVLVAGVILSPAQVPDVNWKIRAAADMDRDGWPDLIWQHEGSGAVSVWLMTGTRLRDGRLMTPSVVPDTNWRIVGAGDLNGDGHADLVWQHQTNGLISVWFMNGTVLGSGVLLSPGQVVDTNWKIRAVTDTNNDGRPDLVWQNQVTGFLSIWLMNGTVRIGDGLRLNPNGVADTNWQIVGPR